jgi:hypothetical protein
LNFESQWDASPLPLCTRPVSRLSIDNYPRVGA